jgi:ABC-type Fe3+/spermidine/putrescine transport system ATPase subunit
LLPRAVTLAVERLTRRFADANRPAVDDISFTVGEGEVLALVGASGSGKTTTLRMIAGYEQPDAGRIVLSDRFGESAREITSMPAQRRGFGMVFQHYALFPHMSVAENIGFGLEARGVSKRERLERAREALERVGLADVGPRAVQSLSGGEQQRVALARAIVIDPPVLLLDEPLSNLDPARRQETREWLRLKLHELKSIAIFVTHDQDDAFAIADRMAVLHDGKLLQLGPPDELYHRPTSVHVAEFIGRSTLVAARREGKQACITLNGVTQSAPAHCRRTARNAGSCSGGLARHLASARRRVSVCRLALCLPCLHQDLSRSRSLSLIRDRDRRGMLW